MSYRIGSALARTVGGVFATIMATALLTVVVMPDAIAQTPPAAQKPPAAAKKPAPKPAQAQQPKPPENQQAQQQGQPPVIVPPLIYRRWTKVCPPKEANAPAGGKQPCFTFTEGQEDSGGLIVRATLMEVEGEPRKGFVVSFMYGVDLQRGTHLVVDQGPLEATAPYVVCVPPNMPPGPFFGCVSQYEVTADMVTGLKKGKILTLQTIINGQTLSPQLPLADFAKAYDGPPTDLKAEAEQVQKLQEALRDRAKKKEEEITRKQGQTTGKP
jgi:invasion protein IalB